MQKQKQENLRRGIPGGPGGKASLGGRPRAIPGGGAAPGTLLL